MNVGRGAVLYDLRPPERRRCCAQDPARHLHHVTAVYEDVDTGQRLYEVWDGTHTTREYILGDDLLYDGMFEPAGWSCNVGMKPTYLLTREHRVEDHHDLMTDGGIRTPVCAVDGCDTPVPGLNDGYDHPRRDGPVCNDCWAYSEDHNHLPDEKPNRGRGGACIACAREDGRIVEDSGGDSA